VTLGQIKVGTLKIIKNDEKMQYCKYIKITVMNFICCISVH